MSAPLLPPLSLTLYAPHPHNVDPSLPPVAASSVYGPYQGHFSTSAEAKAHRRRSRIAAKGADALELRRVKQKGRRYWVKRIYDAMVDVSACVDGPTSVHRARLANAASGFEQADLEAAAHNVFDRACAAHTVGWSRPAIYHKRVVRGKMKDVAGDNLEKRLERICFALQKQKSVVDDALRGGVTLALLVDNPEARFQTKESNNTGNRAKAARLMKGRAQEAAEAASLAKKSGAEQEEEAGEKKAGPEEREEDAADAGRSRQTSSSPVKVAAEAPGPASQGSVPSDDDFLHVPGEPVQSSVVAEHGAEGTEQVPETSSDDFWEMINQPGELDVAPVDFLEDFRDFDVPLGLY